MTTSFTSSSISFEWRMLGRWSQYKKCSTSRGQHSDAIFINVSRLFAKQACVEQMSVFFAADSTVGWMTNAARLIFICSCKKPLKTIKETRMKRIRPLFHQQSTWNKSYVEKKTEACDKSQIASFNVFIYQTHHFLMIRYFAAASPSINKSLGGLDRVCREAGLAAGWVLPGRVRLVCALWFVPIGAWQPTDFLLQLASDWPPTILADYGTHGSPQISCSGWWYGP